MTGTLAQEQGYGLDPRPSHDADENHAEPILAACEIDAERTARMAVRFGAVPREAHVADRRDDCDRFRRPANTVAGRMVRGMPRQIGEKNNLAAGQGYLPSPPTYLA